MLLYDVCVCVRQGLRPLFQSKVICPVAASLSMEDTLQDMEAFRSNHSLLSKNNHSVQQQLSPGRSQTSSSNRSNHSS